MRTSTVLPSIVPTVRVTTAQGAELDPAVRELLVPGAVLDVAVVRGGGQPGKRDGITVGGVFVPAALTPELTDGERVSVQVVKVEPAIILRLLSLEPKRLTLQNSTLLDEAFRSLLSEGDVTALREGLRPSERELGQSVATITQALRDIKSPGAGVREMAARLASFLKRDAVADESVLKDPAKVAALLERAFTPERVGAPLENVRAGLAEAAAAVREIPPAVARAREIPGAIKFIEILKAHLTALASNDAALSFERGGANDPALFQGNLELFLAASHYAIAAGRSHIFESISRQISTLSPKDNPLAVLLRALNLLSTEATHAESPLLSGFARIVDELSRDLQRHRADPEGDREIKGALTAAIQKLETLLRAEKPKAAEAALLLKGADIAADLDRAGSGQEILRSLSPLAHSLGEPAGMIVPLVIHGLLTKFDVSFDPAPTHLDPEEAGLHGGADTFFHRFGLSLTLPGLGALRIDGAHRPGEILLNIACSEEHAAEFIRGELPRLEKAFEALGLEKRTIAARVGAPTSALPAWCRSITRSEIVA